MPNPLAGVETWLYHLANVNATRAAQIAASNADLVVIDAEHSETSPYKAAELNAMRGGQDKLIVSYLSIGEAETYRSYWQSSWNSNPPAFLDDPNPEWPDNYKVRYWDPAWQQIMFRQIDKIIASGFNGLYLDIVDAYQYWADEAPGARNYAQDMANFVKAMRTYAQSKLAALGDTRDFVIISQNAEELITNATYRTSIDGLAKEDLRFYYANGNEGSFRANNWYEDSKPYLEQAERSGIEVFIVEYIPPGKLTGTIVSTLASEVTYLNAHGIPIYISQHRDLTAIYPQPTNVGIPVFGTAAANTLVGTTGNDRIDGRAGSDTISGLAGADYLLGGIGDDRLTGGEGTDRLNGGLGNDTYYLTADADVIVDVGGIDTISSTTSRSLVTYPAIERLFLTGTATTATGNSLNNVLGGNSLANTLTGAAGNDSLIGNAGNDKLIGSPGNDRLTGGPGADVFVFNAGLSSLTNRDTIADFTGVDWIQLENSVFRKIGLPGKLSAAFFWAGVKAHDANDYIIYNRATGVLSYDADGSGLLPQIAFAVLSNKAILTYADFIVI